MQMRIYTSDPNHKNIIDEEAYFKNLGINLAKKPLLILEKKLMNYHNNLF